MSSLGFKSTSKSKNNYNFIGSTPTLLHEMDNIICDNCKSSMKFICQVSTPISNYQRIIYIYSCLKAACNSKSIGWKAFRQIKDFIKPVKSSSSRVYIDFQDVLPGKINQESLKISNQILKEEWIGELYEKQVISGYSKIFKKFSSSISEYPTQILRYEWNGIPLYYSCPDFLPVKDCEKCGTKRVFEFQLMPFLHSILSDLNSDLDSELEKLSLHLSLKELLAQESDWETVLIYSCFRDCGEFTSQEVVIVQGD